MINVDNSKPSRAMLGLRDANEYSIVRSAIFVKDPGKFQNSTNPFADFDFSVLLSYSQGCFVFEKQKCV